MVLSATTKSCLYFDQVTGLLAITGDNTTFTLKEVNHPPLRPNQVIAKAMYFSNDPAQRLWTGSAFKNSLTNRAAVILMWAQIILPRKIHTNIIMVKTRNQRL